MAGFQMQQDQVSPIEDGIAGGIRRRMGQRRVDPGVVPRHELDLVVL
jgi:hypothetical protein